MEEEEEEAELERQIRTIKALQTMEKELMLPTQVVMPVLMKLMRAYDDKWEHIEADGYRLLADMVFAQKEEADMKAAAVGPSGTQFIKKKKGQESCERRSNPARRTGSFCNRIEIDDSDVNEASSLKLVRRIRHPAAKPLTLTSVACAGKRKASEDEPGCEDQTVPLSFRNTNQCVELQSVTERQELNRLSRGKSVKAPNMVNQHTQTEECFKELAGTRNNSPNPNVTQPKQENIPVFLPANEIRRQILNLSVPKTVACDLSIVKQENEPTTFTVANSQKTKESSPTTNSLKFFNPEPLQAVAPTAHLLIALSSIDPSVEVIITHVNELIENETQESLLAQSSTKARLKCVGSNQQLQVKGSGVTACSANPAIETEEIVETHGSSLLVKPRGESDGGLEESAGYVTDSDTSDAEIPLEPEGGVEEVTNLKSKCMNPQLSDARGG